MAATKKTNQRLVAKPRDGDASKAIAILKLKLGKSTKGTHVYTMLNDQGVELGGVYLPKHILPLTPPQTLLMQLAEEE